MTEEVCETLDVGHQRLAAHEAVERVQKALNRLRRSSIGPRVLKVIHGRGRGHPGGSIRSEVREHLHARWDLRAVIPGECYGMFDADTQAMRTECGHFQDPDLDRENAGITLVWVR